MSKTATLALLSLAAACATSRNRVEPAAPPDWGAVKSELAQRVELDQEMRKQILAAEPLTLELAENLENVDADNTAWMKQLVEHHGWPSRDDVGEEGAGNAWLLVQHADQDVDFQERCLALLAASVEAGQADPRHLAYLEDRVAMHRGRPQRYGTQFVQRQTQAGEGPANGADAFVPYSLADPDRVDEWRLSVGLGPLAEYAAQINDSR